MRIRTKAMVICLALSLAPLTIVGCLVYQHSVQMIRQSLGLSFQRLAHEAVDKVDRSLYGVHRNVRTWAELGLMQEVMTSDIDGRIGSFLTGLSKEYGHFGSINVLNRQGEVVASSQPSFTGLDFTAQDCYQATGGIPYVGDAHYSDVEQAWVVTFAFPIYAQFEPGRIIGALCASWQLEELQRMTQAPPSPEEMHGSVMLLRSDGLLIAGGRREELFRRNLLDAGVRSVSLGSRRRSGYLIEAWPSGVPALVGYDCSRGYRDFPGFGWVAVVAQDTRNAFAPIERMTLLVIGIGVGVACCAFGISLVLARQTTLPILRMAQAAQRVAQGDFTVRIDYRSGDELGSLTRTLNQMIEELHRQRAQLVDREYVDNILQSMMDMLVVIDPQGRIRTVNRATCELLGYEERELIGEPVQRIFSTNGALADRAWGTRLAQSSEARNVEHTYVAKDGRRIPVLFSSAALHGSDGDQHGVVCVAQDMTDRKHAETALREQADELERSNAELRQFAYVASHDLQEPLRMVASYIQLLARRYHGRLDQDADEFIRYAVGGVTRMQTLINDLLQYSRVGTRGKPLEPAGCTQVVEHVLRNLTVAIEESGAVVTHDDLPTVYADASQLGQVFQNLIGNAIKFRGEAPPRVHVFVTRDETSWIFGVRDNGIGIDPQQFHRLFTIFQRLHTPQEYPGTGIGLAICKKIVERHGGRIWVESQPGQGSTFSFSMPRNVGVAA